MCRWPFAVRVARAKAKINAANKASPDMTTVGIGKTELRCWCQSGVRMCSATVLPVASDMTAQSPAACVTVVSLGVPEDESAKGEGQSVEPAVRPSWSASLQCRLPLKR